MSITITTNAETIKIDALNLKIQEKVKEKIRESAERVEADAAAHAPVAKQTFTKPHGKTTEIPPGFGRESIHSTMHLDKFFAKVTYLGKGYYMKYPEFGTATQAAQPFLGPAAHREEPIFLESLKDAIAEGSK